MGGRLSRVLTSLLLLRAGYAYVPYSSMESVIEQSTEGYDRSLRRTQGTIRTAAPDWTPWLEFFLRGLQRQKQRLEKKMARERVMLAAMPELSVLILELAREHGRVTTAEAVRVSGSSRNTVKGHQRNGYCSFYINLLAWESGGWGGIRTHERLPSGGFQDRCLKPLGHPSSDGGR